MKWLVLCWWWTPRTRTKIDDRLVFYAKLHAVKFERKEARRIVRQRTDYVGTTSPLSFTHDYDHQTILEKWLGQTKGLSGSEICM